MLTRSWVGIAVAVLCVGVHLLLTRLRLQELLFIVLITLVGTLLDSAFMWSGLFVFDQYNGYLCPPWLVAIWAAFATTVNMTLKLIGKRLWLSVLVGAVAGPLAYFAGVRLGAMTFGWSQPLSLATLSLVWALFLPLVLMLYRTWWSRNM